MTRTASATSLRSPFALMFPEAVEEILDRAEHMNLPRTRYSPLSRRAEWRMAGPAETAADADDDLVIGDEIEIQSCCGRPEVDEGDDEFDV